MALIDQAKLSVRVTTSAFDEEITALIESAIKDLEISGVNNVDTDDALTSQAIVLYVKMNFGVPSNYDNIKKAYDELKSQLSMTSDYTDWLDDDD